MTGFGARGWWFGCAIAATLLLGLAFFFDAAVASWVFEHQTRAGIALMRGVSRWGDWPSHIVLGLLGAGLAHALGSKRWLAVFAAMVLACAVAGLTNRTLKMAAGRSRPSVKVEVGWRGPSLGSKYHSFASGHTASTAAFFGVLCLARRRLALALLPIPLLIASSRIYLKAHYLSDVVFGAMIGVVCAVVIWRSISRRFEAVLERPAV